MSTSTQQDAAVGARLAAGREATGDLPRLLDDLDRVAATRTDELERWRASVHEALDVVAAAISAHATGDESPLGFLATSEERAPHRHHALARLHEEHGELRRAAEEVWTSVASATDAASARSARESVHAFVVAAEHHLRVGDRISVSIADEELGDGD